MPDPAETAIGGSRHIAQGNALRNLRIKQGLSQSELANAARVSLATIVKLERGERVPGEKVKEALAEALEKAGGEAGTGAEAGAEAAAALRAIDWPPPYAAQSYNYRQPINVEAGGPADQLKQLRLATGLTQSQVAMKLGITEQKYARFERGYSRPSESFLKDLARVLGEDVKKIRFE
ncbi:MAG TPA: helix-turn-helix transcriptional regulator [Chloroflexia bacterium]|nr:helix-turn-helix transcriptional regulator [Chloroflexia bacterium]